MPVSLDVPKGACLAYLHLRSLRLKWSYKPGGYLLMQQAGLELQVCKYGRF